MINLLELPTTHIAYGSWDKTDLQSGSLSVALARQILVLLFMNVSAASAV